MELVDWIWYYSWGKNKTCEWLILYIIIIKSDDNVIIIIEWWKLKFREKVIGDLRGINKGIDIRFGKNLNNGLI